MRLDKYINDVTGEGRSLIKKKIKAGVVLVNGVPTKACEVHVDPQKDSIMYEGKLLSFVEHYYYLLHKPAGVVTATEDNLHQTVMDCIGTDIPAHVKKNLFPVGRLDKDTEGLLLLTDDGDLAHALLAPGKHVEKEYLCHTRDEIQDDQITRLEQGVDIGEKNITKPAKVHKIDDYAMTLTIVEGKFHQVKRMLVAVGNEIVYLKRIRMGKLTLPENLGPGEYRLLTKEEVEKLR